MNNANSQDARRLAGDGTPQPCIDLQRHQSGLFTKPVRIGQRAVGWPSDEVGAINAARIAGLSNAEIRDVVTDLHAKRIAPFN